VLVAGMAVLSLLTGVAAEDPLDAAADHVARGMQRFRANKIAESLRDFDRAAELDRGLEPHLWQRGISYYYAGDFEKGRRQFELHQTVNRRDVENAAWHFLCVAQLEGVKSARRQLIKLDAAQDKRIPMYEVYEFYAGRVSEDSLLKAAKNGKTPLARMYAHLYLGLYYEVAGKTAQAQAQMRDAAAVELKPHYMHDVAKVHLRQRKWNKRTASDE
ncbi:hypothetical protein OAS39_12325, partial [Pirellulales bacterium]|nr:hypothetical protein [Pirellulales bacterium]